MPSEKSKKVKSISTAVSGFTILPLSLLDLPSLPESCANAKHYLYIQPHEPSQPTPDTERSLFISNVPIDANETNIRALFAEQLGGSRVQSVDFDSSVPAAPVLKRWKASAGAEGRKGRKRKRDEDVVAEGVVEDEESRLPEIWPGSLRRSGGCAVVIFVDRASAKGAWKSVKACVKEGKEVRWVAGEGLGIQRYKAHHALKYPSPSTLQSSINSYLTQFTATERARTRLRTTQRSVPDEDGFITVTRGGRTGPARLEEAEKKKEELEKRKEKNGVKDDFYRFQNRERRKLAEGELKRKFEGDRRRVEEIRARKGKIRPMS